MGLHSLDSEAMIRVTLRGDTCSGPKPGWTSYTGREAMGRAVTPKAQAGKAACRAIKPGNLGPRLWVSSKAPLLPDVILRGGGRALPTDMAILRELGP